MPLRFRATIVDLENSPKPMQTFEQTVEECVEWGKLVLAKLRPEQQEKAWVKVEEMVMKVRAEVHTAKEKGVGGEVVFAVALHD